MTKNIPQTFSELKKSFDAITINDLEPRELVELARMIYDAGEVYDCPEGTLDANCELFDALQGYLDCDASDSLKRSYENTLRNTVWACLWGAEQCSCCSVWRQDVEHREGQRGREWCLCDDCNDERLADLEHEAHLDWYFYGGRSL